MIDNNNKYMEIFLESAICAHISAIIPPPCIGKKKKKPGIKNGMRVKL